ncbi:MAG: hypothetical protein ACKOUT_07340 [Novosphingobium sp.]
MSKRLALSSALSVMLMAGFAMFGGASLAIEGQSAEASVMPARIEMPAMPSLPSLPILR